MNLPPIVDRATAFTARDAGHKMHAKVGYYAWYVIMAAADAGHTELFASKDPAFAANCAASSCRHAAYAFCGESEAGRLLSELLKRICELESA